MTRLATSAAAARSGLFIAGVEAPVPLAGVRVDAEITGLCARVQITQRYVNREPSPIEAVYVFPLEEGAAVCGFEAIVDGTAIAGEIRPRAEAFTAYDDALTRGDGAYLLDEERPDVFTASIGNLRPGGELLIRIVYVAELSVDEGRARFTLPTTVSPRYAPARHRSGAAGDEALRLQPPIAWEVPCGLTLTARLVDAGTATDLASPSHPIAVSWEAGTATVSLSQEEPPLDRDFVLLVGAASLAEPRAWVERLDGGETAVALAFCPRWSDAVQPGELIFLVDRSGSMDGSSIAELRRALQLCLRSIPTGSRINIVGFGSTFEALYPVSRPYDDRTLAEASTCVDALAANLGGTEILDPLRFVLESPRTGALERQVIVLTDGQVTDTDDVIAVAASHASDARIFTFGIGAGASQHLVRGLARAGGGAAEFIHPGERLEPKVLRQFARLTSPALLDVQVDWGGTDVRQMPQRLRPVFTGGRCLVYGLTTQPLPPTVRLRARSASGPLAFEVPVDSGTARDGRTLATLAARERIRELEELPAAVATRGSRQLRRSDDPTREILDLGLRYGLVSRETSFVAVERRETPERGTLQLRRVPIAITTGWGGLRRPVSGSLAALAAPAPQACLGAPPPPASSSGFCADLLPSVRGSDDSRRLSRVVRSVAAWATRPSRPASPVSAPDRTGLHALVALQRADGSWELTKAFSTALGCDARELEAARPGAVRGARDSGAWATALALAWLAARASAERDEWSALARKARAWLEARVGAAGAAQLTDAAARVFVP
jgi:hypothetical protein